MKITDPQSGKSYVEKRRRRFAEPRQPRELTFSCYRRFPFLAAERTREWFRQWSSARWFAGVRPVKMEMHSQVLTELAWDAGLEKQIGQPGGVVFQGWGRT
jgi:hypothetical protein